ncbi:GrpB family protein [Natrialbaceae archaeon A-CW1-1]
MTDHDETVDRLLGLKPGVVSLVDHESAWADAAAAELDRLESRFAKANVDEQVRGYEHVGSTAVPGLSAKPILDLLVVVDDIEATTVLQPELESMDYERRPNDDVPDRAFFAKGPASNRTHYLSITPVGSDCHREQVVLRDFLRDNPVAAKRYERHKRHLAATHADDRNTYTARKASVIDELLEQAVAAGYELEER